VWIPHIRCKELEEALGGIFIRGEQPGHRRGPGKHLNDSLTHLVPYWRLVNDNVLYHLLSERGQTANKDWAYHCLFQAAWLRSHTHNYGSACTLCRTAEMGVESYRF
jgi:hypothetical protein